MIKIRKRGRRNVARGLPRPAPRRTGEDPAVLAVSYRLCGLPAVRIKLAKFWLTMKATRFPDITLPEAICFSLLQERQIEFVFQQEYNSGKTYRGGAVIDFWIPDSATVIRVQGDYWHGRPERRELDEIQRGEVARSTIEGKRVQTVVDIWESRLRSCERNRAVDAALMGIELGRA